MLIFFVSLQTNTPHDSPHAHGIIKHGQSSLMQLTHLTFFFTATTHTSVTQHPEILPSVLRIIAPFRERASSPEVGQGSALVFFHPLCPLIQSIPDSSIESICRHPPTLTPQILILGNNRSQTFYAVSYKSVLLPESHLALERDRYADSLTGRLIVCPSEY